MLPSISANLLCRARALQRSHTASKALIARTLSSSKSSTTHLVVNAVGDDRPGIVSEISQHVSKQGGNVGASQAAKLGPYFSLFQRTQNTHQRTKCQPHHSSSRGASSSGSPHRLLIQTMLPSISANLLRRARTLQRTHTASKALIARTLSSSKSTSTTHLVVNAVGDDRPGIVSEISQHVSKQGGNVGASQAAKLGPYFSLLMMVECPKSSVDDLKEAITTEMKGMNASIFETTAAAESKPTPAVAYSGRFTVSGADHIGIVHKVTSYLASKGFMIDSMKTTDEIAPHGGTTLFLMEGVATVPEPVPKSFDLDAVHSELAALGDSMNCDVSMVEQTESEEYAASFYGG
eukprot:CAMPEP_0194066440 /NCGR_PEP_ID=MMETSP0009_2-20130614/86022_1 /TAXON_ID=210454 /ORGANISM="Grammatophora oceanica, Strain CCMP 410" /LENGTH=348 /DNA_ID=CAMNT_0038719393 /DNA_START=97 /DNA_END=1143 /DNA_ORIENTATION=-